MNTLIVFFASAIALAAAASLPTPAPPGKHVAILKQVSEIDPEGSYQYSFEAENGISVEEAGHTSANAENAVVASGNFKYTGPDGVPYSVQYVADENGFQPQAAHLPVAPTPPPIPAYIARALDWIAAHPAPPEKPAPPRPPVAIILRQVNNFNPDGSYQYSYETSDGTAVEESGHPSTTLQEQPIVVTGNFKYVSPEGSPISVQYVGDENGFQPQGSHLPGA
ncbi:cuticle protein [Holotrichia oblita]|uniref:Cuticle protein n=1 Tax=Holotrichia oblita TaxID=644536 RepID=A0ACB9TFY5_HOLOL|nr:cuticle protein [Holotrichia oblita]